MLDDIEDCNAGDNDQGANRDDYAYYCAGGDFVRGRGDLRYLRRCSIGGCGNGYNL